MHATSTRKKRNPDPNFFVDEFNPGKEMRRIILNIVLFLIMLTGMAASTPSLDISTGRYNNGCKELKDDVLLSFVFVETLDRDGLKEGLSNLSRWGDYVSKIIGESLYIREKDDIMTEVYAKPLRELEIAEFTRYMIGWTEEPDSRHSPLLTERFTLFK